MRSRMPAVRSWLVVLAIMGPFVAAPGGLARQIGPEAALCAEINSLTPGEELVLASGEYRGPCVIRTGGAPGAPIVIRGADPAHRPRITYRGVDANVLDVRADHVVIQGLAFGPTQRAVDGIRLFARRDITIADNEFSGLGGIAVAVTHVSLQGLTVRRNVIRNSGATAMYFGCHNGLSCTVTDLLVAENYIHGVRAPDSEVGYGIQVKLNSTGVVRDNVIVDIKGPGIMVYGASNPIEASVVMRNFVMGSLTSSGIVVGGGPAVVRDNIAVLNSEGGIALEDYGHRGLLRGVVVLHNTVYRNVHGGILVPEEGLREARIVNNAAQAPPGRPALPTPGPTVTLAGNVDCSRAQCFKDPDGLDFSAALDSPLLAGGIVGATRAHDDGDFFATPRGARPVVGAIQGPGSPIRIGPKP